MTYCCGILVRDGLVMIADTRTNAGLDNISTFRKLYLFERPGERVLMLAASGNLSVTQSVVNLISDGIEDSEIGVFESVVNTPVPAMRRPKVMTSFMPWNETSSPGRHPHRIAMAVSRAAARAR